jgi:anti-sigma B factor antagonist
MPHTTQFPPPASHKAAVPPGFRCTLRDGGLDVAWVRVTGELDIATAPILEQTLRRAEQRARRIVLDLRELAFMDSSGVHVILAASIRAEQAGSRLVLVRGHAQVDRVLHLTTTSGDLEIVDLDPVEPPVQALIQLAQRERAASARRLSSGGRGVGPDRA